MLKETQAMAAESFSSRRKRMRTEKNPSYHLRLPLDLTSFDRTAFPQILAASFNIQKPRSQSLIKRSLRSLISLLATNPSLILPQSILSLLPILLNPQYQSVASLSFEAIGAAALSSLESNVMIASDEAMVKGLVWALGSKSRRFAEAACNALIDVATSPFGREGLRDSYAVEKLLSLFYQVATVSKGFVSPLNTEKATSDDSVIEKKNDKFPALVLDAVVILINTSNGDFLDRMPEELLGKVLPLFNELFQQIQDSTIPPNRSWDLSFLRSKKYDVASVIFRISMHRALSVNWAPLDVRLSIFGTESDFANFVINYWEKSPLLIRSTFKNSENGATIFSSLVHSFDPEAIVSSVLRRLVSCPPITSDELDIFSFLNDVKGVLGSPAVYGQDIRVLKTQRPASCIIPLDVNKEVHFFNDNIVSKFIDTAGVQKCKEAFEDGYTIALRGIEFRSDKIAAVADSLAILFGQPSVGANVYLTPPGSQGLAQHYDDHCVFVWQLYGQKQWKVSLCSATPLPRLYGPIVALPGLNDDVGRGIQYLLNQGDILYIPRGFIHEAHTIIEELESQNETSTDFSLHLTLGIEVEAPFDKHFLEIVASWQNQLRQALLLSRWEGFAHIALHCWNEKETRAFLGNAGSRSRKQRSMFVVLLHIAIRLIADDNPTFMRACMVAASPLSADSLLQHKATFDYIIENVDGSLSFKEAFECIKTVVQERNDDSLQWMRWLRHLSQEGDDEGKIDYTNLLEVLEDVVLSYIDHTAEAMAEFSHFKSRFCRDVIFEDSCKLFNTLLDKYRKVRRQYINGLLSLHSS